VVVQLIAETALGVFRAHEGNVLSNIQ